MGSAPGGNPKFERMGSLDETRMKPIYGGEGFNAHLHFIEIISSMDKNICKANLKLFLQYLHA